MVWILENIQRHVDVDGSRTARPQQAERLFHGERQHFNARRLKAFLDEGPDHRREIALKITPGFLERHAVELRGWHIARDREERRRIHHRAGERDG